LFYLIIHNNLVLNTLWHSYFYRLCKSTNASRIKGSGLRVHFSEGSKPSKVYRRSSVKFITVNDHASHRNRYFVANCGNDGIAVGKVNKYAFNPAKSSTEDVTTPDPTFELPCDMKFFNAPNILLLTEFRAVLSNPLLSMKA
jgi:hypothetical protein